MVIALGPGKFYGRSLPRPRIYDDVKFNDVRVDPPVSVMDPFLSWAEEAHWSMGGLSFKRLRLQGRIEGNISKLRAQQEEKQQMANERLNSSPSECKHEISNGPKKAVPGNPPPAPAASKRRRYVIETEDSDKDVDSADEESSEGSGDQVVRRRLAKNLGDEFDKAASGDDLVLGSKKGVPLPTGSSSVSSRTRIRKSEPEQGLQVNEVVMKVVRDLQKTNRRGKLKKFYKIEEGYHPKIDAEQTPAAPKAKSSPRLAMRKGIH